MRVGTGGARRQTVHTQVKVGWMTKKRGVVIAARRKTQRKAPPRLSSRQNSPMLPAGRRRWPPAPSAPCPPAPPFFDLAGGAPWSPCPPSLPVPACAWLPPAGEARGAAARPGALPCNSCIAQGPHECASGALSAPCIFPPSQPLPQPAAACSRPHRAVRGGFRAG